MTDTQTFYSDKGNYRVKFWQPAREYRKHKEEIDAAIHGCLDRGELVLGFGTQITDFEKNFAEFIGTKYAVMCGSGTQALCLAYASLGIGPGDEVITTSHTFIATIDQIVKLGATPVLVDIGEDGLIDPDLVEKAITPKTKAIVPVHLEGKVCDMTRIMGIARRHGLLVIEDAAQAIGARHITNPQENLSFRKAGSMGNAGCYSFYPAKVLGSVGNAGAVVTDDEDVAKKARMLRCNSNIGKNPDLNAGYGWNLEPDAIQAAVLNVKLPKLEWRLARRKEIAKRYDEAFGNSTPLYLPFKQEGRVYQDYVIRTRTDIERIDLVNFLEGAGIKTLGTGMIPNNRYPKLGLDFHLPNTETYLATQIRLPCNPDLEEWEIEYVIEKVKDFYDA